MENKMPFLGKINCRDFWKIDYHLQEDGTLRKDAEKQVKNAWKKLKAEESERFRLALKVQEYVEIGFDAALAAQYADDALLTTDYGALNLKMDDTDVSGAQESSESDQPMSQ